MAPTARTLIDANRNDQIRIGVTVSLMLLKLGEQLKAGIIGEDEYLAAHVAAEKLGHDQAAVGMAGFIRLYRTLMDPDQEHAEPVLDEFDQGASVGRAIGTVQDLRELREKERTQAEYDSEFAEVIGHAAATGFRHVLNGGRDTMAWSAAANGTRWRRVTGARACSFCVMLATRSDYRTKESAMVVVGRANGYGTARYKATGEVTYGGAMARGARKGQDRRRGTRAPGQRYHDHCSCTVAEVVGQVEPTAEEVAQRDLYERAAAQCDADGVPRTDRNVMERMRQLDDGTVIYDAYLPETATGGAGGGEPPKPRTLFEFGEERPRDYIPPEPGFEMPFDRETRPRATYGRVQHILERHSHDAVPTREGQTFFPADFDEIDVMRELVDRVTYLADPSFDGLALYFRTEVDGVQCEVVMRADGDKWEVRSMWPTGGRGVTIFRDGRKQPLD